MYKARNVHINLMFLKRNLHTSKNHAESQPKSFNEIPGPKPIPFLGTLWMYWPIIGKYQWNSLHHAGMLKYKTWGPLIRENIAPGVTLLWVYDPDDIATLLRNERQSLYPERRSHLALEKYRKDRPNVYNSGGLLPTNGADWWRLRSEFQKGLSAPQCARQFFNAADQITLEFCQYVDKVGSKSKDFLAELSRLNLELICLMAFGTRMDSFSDQELLSESRSSKLIKSAEDTNGCILRTDQGLGLWKYIPTFAYKKLEKAQQYMESVAVDLVSEKFSYYAGYTSTTETIEAKSLLENYISNSKLDFQDIIGMAADLLLAGVDTSSYATSFALYHLAKNEAAQEKLYEESVKILETKCSPMDRELFQNASYTRAVLKESLRLNPISVGVGRIIKKDVVLSGYHIPAGAVAVTQNQVACRLEKNFQQPLKFLPERWLKHDSFEQPHPFLSLPFGYGMRSCIARRFAEQNIQLLLLRLIRNFEIRWNGSDLDVKTMLINKPDQPLKFTFRRRSL